jgi:hypothetical protein
MARIDDKGYISRREAGGNSYRNWWLIKHHNNNSPYDLAYIALPHISIPKYLIGKKVRFKLEVAYDLP